MEATETQIAAVGEEIAARVQARGKFEKMMEVSVGEEALNRLSGMYMRMDDEVKQLRDEKNKLRDEKSKLSEAGKSAS